MRPQSAKSQFQINFQTRLTFKRNKRYVDLDQLSSNQKQISILRRRPLKSEDNHIDQKINSSFLNTTAELTQKAYKSSIKHKSRVSFNESFQQNTPQSLAAQQNNTNSKPDKKRSRSFSMQKMTSREYHHIIKNKPVADERRFNNFTSFKPYKPFFCDYTKMKGKFQGDQVMCTDIQYNTQKLYEEYYYKKTTNNCKVDYKSEKKLKSERVFFSPKRAQNMAATELDPFKVNECKDKLKINKQNIQQFYRNSGRELPGQVEMREMNELTNYWKGEQGKIKRPGVGYETKKKKQDMQNDRIRKIQYLKQVKHNRNQVCDQQFFRRMKQ